MKTRPHDEQLRTSIQGRTASRRARWKQAALKSIRAVTPFLQTKLDGAEIRNGGFTWISNRLVAGVTAEGARKVFELIDVARASPDAQMRWGDDSVEDFVYEALARIAYEELTASTAFEVLSKRLNSSPKRYTTVVPIYGVVADDTFSAAAVEFTADHERVISDLLVGFVRAEDLKKTLHEQLESGLGHMLARSHVLADGDRSASITGQRIQLALCVLVRAEVQRRLWPYAEIDAGTVRSHHAALVGTDSEELGLGGNTRMGRGRAIRVVRKNLTSALTIRSGLARLDVLGSRLPSLELGELEGRLLRAASCLAGSLQGDAASRFLWRWMGLEALLGDREGTVIERLTDRLSVVLEDDATRRADRKAALRDLYSTRNRLAHGSGPLVLASKSAYEFRETCFWALERIAALHFTTDAELFAWLEEAKFTGARLEESISVAQ